VHAGPLGSGRTSIEHPVAVAKLLSDAGFPPHVLAAALLHDTVEDGDVEIERLSNRRAGPLPRNRSIPSPASQLSCPAGPSSQP
jgi:hypothetical protein